ncbi:MAG: hypothetical protein ABSA10_05495 [Anaerolineales bacterium]|jgi:hypothetical protein
MTRLRIPLAAALIALPILIRTVWFYQGYYWRGGSIATPEYNSFTIPQPPLSTPAALPEPDVSAPGGIILLDQSHENLFSSSELASLTGIIDARGGRVENILSGNYDERTLADQLKYAAAYISVCPTISYSSGEVQLLQEFVQRGGRLLILTDPTRSVLRVDYSGFGSAVIVADVIAANTLLAPFDITFSDDYLYNMTEYEGNFRNVYIRNFGDHPLTDGLQTLVLYAAHSIQTQTGTSLLLTSGEIKSSRTDQSGGFSAAALDASGKVLAIGDMSFLQPPYNQVADNALWIQRIADFLLGAERVHDLKDFPFLFQRPVVIVPMSDVSLSASLLGPITSIQQELASVGVVSSVATEAADGKDLIILGTYSSPGITKYIDPLGITLPSTSVFMNSLPMIDIPGFGSIPSTGIGLVLLSRTDTRTTLLLLAEESYSLTDLMSVIGPNGFSNCVMQGNVAVCGLSGGSSFGG